MRIVIASRILNEEDIVEAFVRHNATFAAHLLFFDNGSTDRTLAILLALRDEGLPISVFQARAVGFDEARVNTWLYETADGLHRPDWVAFLDVDEFIVAGEDGLAPLLAPLLAAAPAPAVALPLVNYHDTADDDPAELVIPRRLRWRARQMPPVPKVIVRGGFGARCAIAPGNHGASVDGVALPHVGLPGASLAHYPRRSGWHDLQKSAIGWLKVLAAGGHAAQAGYSAHYRVPFERLRDAPASLLREPAYLAQPVDPARMVLDPIAYRGGELRHTVPSDPAMRALAAALHHAEALARAHGRLLDESAEARGLVARWNGERNFLF